MPFSAVTVTVDWVDDGRLSVIGKTSWPSSGTLAAGPMFRTRGATSVIVPVALVVPGTTWPAAPVILALTVSPGSTTWSSLVCTGNVAGSARRGW